MCLGICIPPQICVLALWNVFVMEIMFDCRKYLAFLIIRIRKY